MRKPLKPIFFGTLLGLLIGGSLRYVDHSRNVPSTPSLSSSKRVQPALADEAIASILPDPLPRQTLEEVLQLGGYADAETLVRYLADASIEEVIELMESFWRYETDLYDLQWMVEMRGLDLDPDAIQTAAKTATNSDAFVSLLTTWVKMDPIAALEADLREHSQLTRSVMYGMLDGDLDQAIAAIKAVQPNTPILKEFEDLKLTQLAHEDPNAALTEVVKLADGQDRREKLFKVLEVWTEKDPLSAIEWVEKHRDVPYSRKYGDVMATAVANLAESHPQLARLKLEALAPGQHRVRAEHIVMKKLAAQDKNSALEWVRELPSSPHRQILVVSLLEGLDEEPEGLFEIIQELANNGLYQGGVFKSKLSVDKFTPQEHKPGGSFGLIEAALEVSNESPKDAMLALRSFGVDFPKGILDVWLDQDPEAAVNWAARLAPSEASTKVQHTLINAWAADSPEAVAASMTANGLSKNLDLSQTLANLWVQRDAEASLVWASKLDPQIRDEVLKTTIMNVAFTDPVQALQYVNEIQNPEAHHEALTRATRSWRIKNPEDAMTWLLNQPREAAIDDIVMSSAQEWVLSQPQLASKWIGAITPGPQKDQAVAGLVGALISEENPTKDFASAEVWAQTISDPALRQQRLNEIAEAR